MAKSQRSKQAHKIRKQAIFANLSSNTSHPSHFKPLHLTKKQKEFFGEIENFEEHLREVLIEANHIPNRYFELRKKK